MLIKLIKQPRLFGGSGRRYRSKEDSASFEESLDLCVDTAKKLLIKKKEMA
jgi:hypothetical protein